MNRKKAGINLSSVDVRDKRYDPHTDSYLILAKFKQKSRSGKGWLVAWQPRANSIFVDASFHQSEQAAHRRLLAVIRDKNLRSDHALIENDRQQQKCYRWEDDVVMPYSQEISLEEAEDLIAKVCADYGIFPPELIWGKPGYRSEYIEEEAAIELHHHDKMTLLHELAHHLHVEDLDDAPHSHHGPGFISWLIELYNRYAGIELDKLVTTAGRRGLLGDLNTPSIALGLADNLSEKFRKAAQDAKSSYPANDNKLKLERLEILAEHTHGVSGARLIMGQRPENGQFVIAWVAPWQKTLTDFKIRKTPAGGMNLWKRLKERDPPQSPSLIRDWQRALAYEWEDEHIGPGTAMVEEDKMKRIVDRIARDFNIAAPAVSYQNPRSSAKLVSSWYGPDHAITMQHKDYYCLLHEMARAIDVKLNGNKWADHGPSFIRTLIHIASRYNWDAPQQLEESAKDWGLVVAKEKDLPKLFSPKGP